MRHSLRLNLSCFSHAVHLIISNCVVSPLNCFFTFVKDHLGLFVWVPISGVSIQSHWSVYLSLHQYYTVLITVVVCLQLHRLFLPTWLQVHCPWPTSILSPRDSTVPWVSREDGRFIWLLIQSSMDTPTSTFISLPTNNITPWVSRVSDQGASITTSCWDSVPGL